jgi:hypothetical protein
MSLVGVSLMARARKVWQVKIVCPVTGKRYRRGDKGWWSCRLGKRMFAVEPYTGQPRLGRWVAVSSAEAAAALLLKWAGGEDQKK